MNAQKDGGGGQQTVIPMPDEEFCVYSTAGNMCFGHLWIKNSPVPVSLPAESYSYRGIAGPGKFQTIDWTWCRANYDRTTRLVVFTHLLLFSPIVSLVFKIHCLLTLLRVS